MRSATIRFLPTLWNLWKRPFKNFEILKFLNFPYYWKFFKGYLLNILLGLFLNTLNPFDTGLTITVSAAAWIALVLPSVKFLTHP